MTATKKSANSGRWEHDLFEKHDSQPPAEDPGYASSRRHDHGRDNGRDRPSFAATRSAASSRDPEWMAAQTVLANSPHAHALVLSNLFFEVEVKDLKEMFAEFDCIATGLKYDLAGRSTGTAVVVFATKLLAGAARERYADATLDGLKLEIRDFDPSKDQVRPPPPPSTRDSGSRGHGGANDHWRGGRDGGRSTRGSGGGQSWSRGAGDGLAKGDLRRTIESSKGISLKDLRASREGRQSRSRSYSRSRSRSPGRRFGSGSSSRRRDWSRSRSRSRDRSSYGGQSKASFAGRGEAARQPVVVTRHFHDDALEDGEFRGGSGRDTSGRDNGRGRTQYRSVSRSRSRSISLSPPPPPARDDRRRNDNKNGRRGGYRSGDDAMDVDL
ncbi:hypothetical protein BC828DRAFT_391646 [Blastocladiella britannica]|nr:hypothetical protein BC828DRAFT_391646 [Blastocladiella britannica]